MHKNLKRFATKFRQSATSTTDYWLTRFVILRVLGFVYFFAYLSLALQVIPLIGTNGLLPAEDYLQRVGTAHDSKIEAFMAMPTIFWLGISDNALLLLAWAGVILSAIVALLFANSIIMAGLWLLYMSYVNIGQLWYGYGWEIQLLETGFLAIFIVPLIDMRPFPRMPPPVLVIWLLRWLALRINLGAGLIKIRHDTCWRDLTCLFYHYETQPIPSPLSPWIHFMPKWFHKAGVLLTHFVQLITPLFIFAPIRKLRIIAGIVLIAFQGLLIATGNYSFLNWITIVAIIAVFDDKLLKKAMPKWILRRAEMAALAAKPHKGSQAAAALLAAAIILLSLPVVANLLSENQAMNTSFNQWALVNTYGAFGSITRERHEIVFAGTSDDAPTPDTEWKEYEFHAKPTNTQRGLPIIAPYQPRIDWQLWFAAFQNPSQNPWIINFIWKILNDDYNAKRLVKSNPFADEAPKFVKADLYRYEFIEPWKGQGTWKRTYIGSYIPPLSKETIGLREFIQANGWATSKE